jgi:hypothetical protein
MAHDVFEVLFLVHASATCIPIEHFAVHASIVITSTSSPRLPPSWTPKRRMGCLS